ncbi:hypothetical protein [Allokutzneria oryzae]|uniref:Uncharacterized protein n=1 Tax=Allokutzneria oryzae TaxID=1378989 RepID=A0ABV5ZRP7_9PSEU
MSNHLSLTVTTPKDSAWGETELRVLVDGEDVAGACFDAGPNHDPDHVLGPGCRLLPGSEPRRVRIAEAECVAECCGALSVLIRREGEQIVWYDWENTSDRGEVPAEFRFDAAQYEAELTRAERDRSWEWPARVVARLVRAELQDDPNLLGRWDSSMCFVFAKEHHIDVTFFTPPPARGDHYHLSRIVAVTDEPAEAQAERFLTALRAVDPREDAMILGGSAGAGALRGVKYRDR